MRTSDPYARTRRKGALFRFDLRFSNDANTLLLHSVNCFGFLKGENPTFSLLHVANPPPRETQIDARLLRL